MHTMKTAVNTNPFLCAKGPSPFLLITYLRRRASREGIASRQSHSSILAVLSWHFLWRITGKGIRGCNLKLLSATTCSWPINFNNNETDVISLASPPAHDSDRYDGSSQRNTAVRRVIPKRSRNHTISHPVTIFCLCCCTCVPLASLASAFVGAPLPLQAPTSNGPSCSTHRSRPTRMMADGTEDGKVSLL